MVVCSISKSPKCLLLSLFSILLDCIHGKWNMQWISIVKYAWPTNTLKPAYSLLFKYYRSSVENALLNRLSKEIQFVGFKHQTNKVWIHPQFYAIYNNILLTQVYRVSQMHCNMITTKIRNLFRGLSRMKSGSRLYTIRTDRRNVYRGQGVLKEAP